MILSAALALGALAIRSGAGVDILRDRSRTDKTHGANFGFDQQRIYHGFTAVHQIDHALGNPVFPAIRKRSAW